MNSPRLVFLGTGDIALPTFQWLISNGYSPVGLVTQPDRPAGRKRKLKPPVIKEVALEADIPVLQPEKIRDVDALQEVDKLKPDLIVVMAYGQILPKRLIEMPPLGCVNLHASLLPKYRGAACIQAAIDAGDSHTGITLMHVVKQLDAGDVIFSRSIPIGPKDTGGTLHDMLAEIAVDVMEEGLPQLINGTAPRIPQKELGEASHVPKLDREDGRIEWQWSAERIERRLRAYDPWPGCWAKYSEGDVGKRVKIFPGGGWVELSIEPGRIMQHENGLIVGCGTGAIVLGDVQPDGGRRMSAADWWRGLRDRSQIKRLH